jgi:hypothetical protein
MDLHRDFADAEIMGDLLAEAPPHDLDHDLALPRTQRLEALSERVQILVVLPPDTIASEAEMDRIDEVLITERLGQNSMAPPFIACTDIGTSP